MAFAGAGTSSMGLSAVFWNPAAVTRTKGFEAEAHISGILPRYVITTLPSTSAPLLALGNTSIDIGKEALVPTMYLGYQVNPNFYLGLAFDSPFGQKIGAPLPWAGQNQMLNAQITSFEANPVVGYKVNDMISLGAGLRVIRIRGESSSALSPSATAPNLFSFDVADTGVGWNAGITFTPWAGTEIALGYRSAVAVSLDGSVSFPPVAPLPGVYGVDGKATLPAQASLGIRQQVSDAFALLGTAEWQHWSKLQLLSLNFTSGPRTGATAANLFFDFRDAWYFSLGGEYRWDRKTTLRAGIGYEVTPITDAQRDPTVPFNNGWRFSLGMTRQLMPAMSVDIGYSYILVDRAPFNIVPPHHDARHILFPGLGQLAYFGYADTSASIIAVAMRYSFAAGNAVSSK
jgi:long-chain fatty acid transport protein